MHMEASLEAAALRNPEEHSQVGTAGCDSAAMACSCGGSHVM